MTIKFSDITGGGIPYGDNAGRPANPGVGKLYSNGEEKRLELYTNTGWQNIVSETPGVVSVSGNYLESIGSATLEITGTNFSTGAIATAIGTDGIEVNANSTTVNSIVSISATFSGLSAAYEPYDIKVTNTSNLFGLLPDALYVNQSPIWQTSAGSLGTFNEQVSITLSALSATDPESTSVTYALASGSTLPSGVSLNGSTGVISGTLPDITTDTTYSFTINASDGLNTIPRAFSITSKYTIPVEYLIVGGGGGGSGPHGGGGGAGGVLSGLTSLLAGATSSISIGTGGYGSSQGYLGSNGLSTTALSLIAGGGGGAGRGYSSTGSAANGLAGDAANGSGGGAGSTAVGGSGNGAGNSGGNGNSSSPGSGGGGGGAGAPGANGFGSGSQGATGGAGGIGIQSSITGTATYYAGGGGGGGWTTNGAAGGLGGGGRGGNPSENGTDGTANTGGGGGAGGDGSSVGARGGSGVVVLAYPNTYPALTVPGTLTYDTPTRSGYRVYRFTAGSGIITF